MYLIFRLFQEIFVWNYKYVNLLYTELTYND